MAPKQPIKMTNAVILTDTLTVGIIAVPLTPGNVNDYTGHLGDITEVRIQADPANGQNIQVGTPQEQYWELVPGAEITIRINHLEKVGVVATAGMQLISYIAVGR